MIERIGNGMTNEARIRLAKRLQRSVWWTFLRGAVQRTNLIQIKFMKQN